MDELVGGKEESGRSSSESESESEPESDSPEESSSSESSQSSAERNAQRQKSVPIVPMYQTDYIMDVCTKASSP
eukprot:scaffold100515_cov22-Tisochrysis_lutea.AAC.1